MPDYELTRLGSRAFEQLVVSLSRSELGAGVSVFGDGPDGGREATFEGTINWSRTTFNATATSQTPVSGSALADPDAPPALASATSPGIVIDGFADSWRGYTVLQSKFHLTPSARPTDNAAWLRSQITNEIGHWVTAKQENKRARFPDYLIFVTNVELSSVALTGGVDTVARHIENLLGPNSDARKVKLFVRGAKVWHADQVRAMLDAHQDVRWAFPALLTVGDVLMALTARQTGPALGTNTLEDPLRLHLLAGQSNDRWIRLGQAGATGADRLFLDDVAIDLPATVTLDPEDTGDLNTDRAGADRGNGTVPAADETVRVAEAADVTDPAADRRATTGPSIAADPGGAPQPGQGLVAMHGRSALTVGGRASAPRTGQQQVRAVAHVLARGDANLSARQAQSAGRPGIVLVGGPGQGKTTLGQLIAQAYRAAMLDDADLAPRARAVVDGTKSALRRLGLKLPGNRRWPMRVDLAKYAEELSCGAQTSLLRWITKLVQQSAYVDLTPQQLVSWMQVCPWALILDGLDEVPSLDARRLVYDQLEDFLVQVDDLGADVLVVVTTRPTGYDEQLPDDRFEHVLLQPLPAGASSSFAAQLTALRFQDDDEMRREVAARMRAASEDPTTSHLMVTPLQVTIMAMIVERFPTLPPDRFTLFQLYYRTVFDREVAKPIAGRILNTHRNQVDRLHERVGLALQAQSERADGAEAVLDPAELHVMARAQLAARGYSFEEADQTATQIVQAATHRLVLLVPRERGLGFEIRTLQELMAARAVCAGEDAAIERRLQVLAHNPHWRNTWLLAAGKLLDADDRFEEVLGRVLRSVSEGPLTLGRRLSPAPVLAADMYSDGLARRRPTFERQLVHALLAAVDYVPSMQPWTIGLALNTLLDDRSRDYRNLVTGRLTAAQGFAARASAAALLMALQSTASPTDAGRRQTAHLALQRLALTVEERTALITFQPSLSTFSPRDPLAGLPVFDELHVGPADHGREDAGGDTGATPGGMVVPDVGQRGTRRRRRRRRPDAAAGARGVVTGAPQLVADTLRAAIADLGVEPEPAERLEQVLTILGGTTYALTQTDPPLAILDQVRQLDDAAMADIVDDETVAVALELALGSLSPGLWPLPGLLAESLHRSLSRRPVGDTIVALVAADQAPCHDGVG